MLVIANKLGATIISNGAFDTDAQTFFTAVEGGGDTLTGTQKSAVNKLVVDMKAAGVWTKMKAVYPLVGGTSTSHKWNLKDPRDLDAAYRLVFVGAPTHDSNGVDWNGTTQYADTKLTASTALNADSFHLSYYSKEDDITTAQIDMGCLAAGVYFDMAVRLSDGRAYFQATASGMINVVVATGAGFTLGTRTGAGASALYKNGASIGTSASASTPLPAYNVYLAARNGAGAAVAFSKKRCAFASIGDGISAAEATALNTAVTTYQTTLGRNV